MISHNTALQEDAAIEHGNEHEIQRVHCRQSHRTWKIPDCTRTHLGGNGTVARCVTPGRAVREWPPAAEPGGVAAGPSDMTVIVQ